MNHATNGADVDGAMQDTPAAAAEAANPSGGRSDRQRNKQSKSEKAYSDERALVDVLPDFTKVEGLVKNEISGEVKAGVEEGVQTEHSAEANEFREVKELTKWSNAECDYEAAEDPIAGAVLNESKRIGNDGVSEKGPSDCREWNQTDNEEKGFAPLAGEEGAHVGNGVSNFCGDPCRSKGWRPGRSR